MIKNERQYKITKAQTDKFERALLQMDLPSDPSNQLHPLFRKAQRDALSSQLSDLRTEITEYEALQAGKHIVLTRESIEDLPSVLIQARIAVGLSQKELADRLGIKEQQVQRYEATEYISASLERIIEVTKALGISIREDVFLPNAKITPATFFQNLKKIGFNRDFVLNKMLPRSLAAYLTQAPKEGLDKYVLQAATIVSRFLHCTVADFFSATVSYPSMLLSTTRFKLPSTAKEPQVKAYTMYAHHMALLALQATEGSVEKKQIPTEVNEFCQIVKSKYGSLSFESILKYAWSLGIIVLPLDDSGTFHGACWRIQGRNIVIIKQKTDSLARWCFNLLHEMRHLAQAPELDELCVIESSETSKERRDSEEERDCSQFASDVLLEDRAEELVEMCVEASKSRVQSLITIVPKIAREQRVSVGALANHMAFRLLQDDVTNWWGVADGLQESGDKPLRIAREMFLKYADFSKLNEIERTLLQQALSE